MTPARLHRLTALLAPMAALLLGLAAACTGDRVALIPVPDGATVVAESAAATARLQTAHVLLTVDPPVGGLPIVRDEGDHTQSGGARGSLQLRQGGAIVPIDYLRAVGGDLLLRWPTGPDWLPAGPLVGVYDPSGVLDPGRGVAALLGTATGAVTEGAEELDGVAAWRVAVSFDQSAVAALVPGVPGGLTGELWIAKDSGLLLRALVRVSDPASTITVSLGAFDAAVAIQAP